MIRQRNKLNIFCLLLFAILELASLLGAYLVNSYTRSRLGMLRHMVYLNGKWEESLPINQLRILALAILGLLLLIFLVRYIKLGKVLKSKAYNIVVAIYTLAITIFSVVFIVNNSASDNRAYYIMGLLFVLASLFQHVFYHCFLTAKKDF